MLKPLESWQRYILVGSLLAAGYFGAAVAIEGVLDVSPSLSSTGALLLMTFPAYLSHKLVTFESSGAHCRELPRFIITTMIGVFLSWAIPWWAVTQLAMPSAHSYALICVLVPGTNYIMLRGFVFVTRGFWSR